MKKNWARKMPGVTNGTPQPLTLGSDEGAKKDFRQMCKYGEDCYQKNPMHHQKFRHPKPGDKEKCKEQENETGLKNEEETKEEVASEENETTEPASKKIKLDEEVEEKEETDGASGSKSEEPQVFDDDEKDDEEFVDIDSDLIPDIKDWATNSTKTVEEIFLVKMPEDFMAFWDFCKGINREDPRQALAKTCGLVLVGPFDILAKQEFTTNKLNDFLCHYRYYRDPSEFQTLIASTDENSNFHIGYFRDDPKEVPVFVAAYGGKKDTPEFKNNKFTLLGDNLFAALYLHVGQLVNQVDPFKMTALHKLKNSIHVHATMKNQDQSFTLDAKTTSMKCRDKKKVAATFHGAGLVVPYDKHTQVGYREIPETNASLKKIMSKIIDAHSGGNEEAKNKAFDVLQELVTNVQFANDEGDPGMGLELGIDLILHGGNCLNSTARHLLTVAYELLDREAFSKVANAHLNRRKEKHICFKAV